MEISNGLNSLGRAWSRRHGGCYARGTRMNALGRLHHPPTSPPRGIVRSTPDLTPWLSMLWAVRREADAPEWAAALSAMPGAQSAPLALHPMDDRSCLLAGASLGVAPAAVARLAHRLLGASGTSLRTGLTADAALSLLAAAIDQDD